MKMRVQLKAFKKLGASWHFISKAYFAPLFFTSERLKQMLFHKYDYSNQNTKKGLLALHNYLKQRQHLSYSPKRKIF